MHIQWPRCDPVRSLFCVISPDLSVSLLRYDLHLHPFLCVRECDSAVILWSNRKTLQQLSPFNCFLLFGGEGSESCRVML